MDLTQLTKQITRLNQDQSQQPPFEQWHPKFCGKIDIVIKRDGTWWHLGSQIKRDKLVSLFASVLIIEEDSYYLKTPAEKMLIEVEDVPFVITQWRQIECDPYPAIEVTSNLGHKVLISQEHPITINNANGQQTLYVTLHRRLKAVVHRNVCYQWIEIGEEKVLNGQQHLMIKSGDCEFSLGTYE